MPCEEIIQVVGTLIPQDKESFGSVTSHEENAIFIFEESRTLLSNQLAQGDFLKITQKQQSLRKEPNEINYHSFTEGLLNLSKLNKKDLPHFCGQVLVMV
ncbi:hypothetical protein ACTWQL_06470 [Pseudalkalibacillus sp. R45]|uniref:hypothetical protein n=1 Tax=Pseudalkalibacillus sp. R45 TaxID=3457433 RepID=UPI003FCE5219